MITKKLIKPISKVGIANVDLDNYYTKPQVDSKLDTKQDTLTAGNNITISNNVISANVPQVDLSDYYNKQEIDTTINGVNSNISNNTNDITNLKAKDTQLESDIATIKTQQTTQDQQITSNRDLSNQIIEGLKTLRVFNYVGTFNSQTTYKRNDVVDSNNRLFLSKVDSNVGHTPPSDNQSNTYWLLLDGVQASVDLSNYYTKIEVDDKLQDYLAITTFDQTIQQIQNKQVEQDTLISQKANISDLNGYAKLDETNNNNFYIGNKNGQHIWFAKPFQYSGATYASIKIRNGNANYLTIEHNFRTNQSIISNPRGSVQLKNIATPTENNDGVNKQYVDTKIAAIPSTDLTNYYTRNEVDSKVNSLVKTITFEAQATFHYVDGLNVSSQRYRWYRIDTSSTPLNVNNCLNIEYRTNDPKEITFSYKWESDTSILLTFCKVNGQQDYRAVGTIIAKYI